MKRVFYVLFFSIFLFLGFDVVSAAELSSGTYRIQSAVKTNMVLDVTGGSSANGTKIQLYSWNNVNAQKWKVEKLSNGYYKITSVLNDSKVLDVAGAGKSNGTKVQIYSFNNTTAQQWLIKDAGGGYYYIISRCNNLYVDVAGGKSVNGTAIQMYRGNGTKAQKFKFLEILEGTKTLEDGIYTITSAKDNTKGLDVTDEKTSNGSNVRLYNNAGTYGQIWNVKYLNNGFYSLTTYLDNKKALDICGGGSANGTNVQIYSANGTSAQQWILKETGDGYYYIISKLDNMYLDVAGGFTNNGTNIQIYTGNGSAAQKFKITKVSIVDTIDNGLYTIDSALNSKLNVASDVAYNSANVNINASNDSNGQKWFVKYVGGGYYTISSGLNSNKVLDVAGGNINSGTNVQIYSANGTDSQKWFLKDAGDGYYYIISKKSKLYLDVLNGSSENGTNVQMNTYQETAQQKFKLTTTNLNETSRSYEDGYYTISSASNLKQVIDATSGSKVDNTNVQIYSSNNTLAQIWYLKYLDNGFYSITSSMNPTKVSLEVAGGSMNSGANVDLNKYAGSDAMTWLIKDTGDGYVSIISKLNGLYLNVNGEATSGTNVTVSNKADSDNQKFKLTSYTGTKVYTGIDVSKYQGDIDWTSVANTNMGFVIIRAGYGSDLSNQDDAKFVRNVGYCEKYNIPYGIYLYSYATSTDSGEASAVSEAKHALRLLNEIKAKGYKPTLGTQVFIDMEDSSTAGLGKEKLTAIANKFCSTIENSGYTCGIYSSKNWFIDNLDTPSIAQNYNIWLSQWPSNNTINSHFIAQTIKPDYNLSNYKYWQFTSKGSVAGINGYVDLDLGYDIFD